MTPIYSYNPDDEASRAALAAHIKATGERFAEASARAAVAFKHLADVWFSESPVVESGGKKE